MKPLSNVIDRIGDFSGRHAKCLLACFLAAALSAGLATCAKAQIELPIEVVGVPPYTDSRTVWLDSTTGIDSLWMQVNNLAFALTKDSKGALRVNGGSWVDLSNTTFVCEYPYTQFQCTWGSYGTIRGKAAVSGLVVGENTLDWRFNASDGITSGYRVLDFNLTAAGVNQIPADSFDVVDPTTWTYDAAKVTRGGVLFDTEPITISDIDGTTSTGFCRSCHFEGGMDLKALAYSDKSIITRSVFHGLSTAQGDSIAAYIRDNAQAVVGRPWNPIFQPGPGLDAGTDVEWFAGAGLDYVFDDDLESLPYYLAQVDSLTAVYGDNITRGTFNMREFPIARQLPDWNRWLPRVFPGDIDSNFLTSQVYTCYTTTLPDLLDTNPTATVAAKQFENCFDKSNSIASTGNDSLDALNQLSFRQWKAFKIMDLHFEYGLFDSTAQAYPAMADGREHGEVRGTLGIKSPTFTIAPHRIDSNDNNWPYIQENNGVFSSDWYIIAVLMNPGFRYATEQNVIDWKYNQPHITNNVWGEHNYPQFVLHQANFLKLMQQENKDLCDTYAMPSGGAPFFRTLVNMGQCSVGNTYDANYGMGWNWRGTNVSQTAALDVNNDGEYVYSAARGMPTVSEAKQVIQPIVKGWIARTDDFVGDDWCRATGQLCLTPASYTPSLFTGSGYFVGSVENASQLYRLVGQYWPSLGIDYDVLLSVATWADNEWANADPDYVDLIGSAPSAPSAPTLASPADAATGVELDVTLSWAASSGATNYDVEYDDNAGFTSPTTQNVIGGLNYQPNFTGVDEGTTQYWHVRANNGGGSSAYSTARSFTLVSSSLYTERDDQLGEFSTAGSRLTLTDTTGTAIYKLDFGALADGERFVVVVDSVSRSADDSTRYNWGVLAIVEDTTDADLPFGAVGLGERVAKGFWNSNAAAADSAAKGVFILPGTPMCLGVARTGDALALQYSYYLGGSCASWTDIAIDTYTVSVPMPATTNYVASVGIRSRTTGEDATGYVRNVYIEAIE